jgi:hypothetical protein
MLDKVNFDMFARPVIVSIRRWFIVQDSVGQVDWLLIDMLNEGEQRTLDRSMMKIYAAIRRFSLEDNDDVEHKRTG